MNRGDLNKVWEIKTLIKRDREDEAREILQKIASQVEPIMRKINGELNFFPSFGLDVGRGVQIMLRLQRPNRQSEFYPYHQVLDTMLHKLCHNAHGPHNANFYKLWDELRKECEYLISKGITSTGEGFDLRGKRLGGSSRQPPLSSLRQIALTTVEKRLHLGSLLPYGPKRLGGDSNIMVALIPIQATTMAAERRMQDDLWCGSSGMLGEEESNSNELQKALICDVWGSQKPKDVAVKFKTWSCKFCTLGNNIKEERCSAYKQWRNSSGPLVSFPASSVGIWD